MVAGHSIARVVLDTPLPQLDLIFEYRIPEKYSDQDLEGFLVKVPLRGGKRFCEAWVVETTDRAEFTGNLATIEEVISTRSLLPRETYDLAKNVSLRQAGTVSDVLRHIIPRRYVRTEKAFRERKPAEKVDLPPTPIDFHEVEVASGSRNAMVIPAYFTGEIPQWAQFFCVEAIRNLNSGHSTILCVPDFRDLSLLNDYLLRFVSEDHILRLDTKQLDKERFQNYLHSISEVPAIILGNRSSVLSPAHNLGGIYVWDEADGQMIEPQAPYYNARDVALLRQRESSCSLTFASYARSVAIQRLVSIGWLSEISINPSRKVAISFTEEEDSGITKRIPSAIWQNAKEAVKHGPILFQVARAGVSTALACGVCKERAVCSSCQGFLALGTRGSLLQCRQCRKVEPQFVCPHCSSREIRYLNSGSEKTAEEIGKAFPGIPVILSDGNHVITEIKDIPSIVIATPGTEPIASQGYRAVIVLDGLTHRLRDIPNADEEYVRRTANAISLCRPDSKSQIVSSGEILGKVFSLNHYIPWAQNEYELRNSLKLPPCVRTATLTGKHQSVTTALEEVSQFNVRIFGPHQTQDNQYRSVIFFDYKDGDDVASSLKATVVSTATKTRRPNKDSGPRLVELRVKMDDATVTVI